MRVVLFTYQFLPFTGGIATYCYELACGLRQRGHAVTVVALKSGSIDTEEFPFPVRWIEPRRRTSLRISAMRTLHSTIRQFAPDVILATERSALTVAALLRILTNIESVPIVHGSEILTLANRGSLYRSLVARVMRNYFMRAKCIICISNYTQELLLDYFSLPADKPRVVHNGLKNRFDRRLHSGEPVRDKWNISLDAKVLLTLARLTPRKGQDTIIRALPRILERHPDAVYLCAGMGDYRTDLELLASKMGVDKYVIFPGRVSNKYSYYAACDLFVMPSRQDQDGVEGFGLCFLEAWHASKPVMGSTHGGVVEVISHGFDGVTVDPDDVDAVADSIISLLSDPAKLKEMGIRGNEKATRRLTDLVMADKVIQALS